MNCFWRCGRWLVLVCYFIVFCCCLFVCLITLTYSITSLLCLCVSVWSHALLFSTEQEKSELDFFIPDLYFATSSSFCWSYPFKLFYPTLHDNLMETMGNNGHSLPHYIYLLTPGLSNLLHESCMDKSQKNYALINLNIQNICIIVLCALYAQIPEGPVVDRQIWEGSQKCEGAIMCAHHTPAHFFLELSC